MRPEDAHHGHHQHHGAQVFLDLDIEMRRVSEGHHDDVREEDAVLKMLGPHRAPVEEMDVGLLDDGHVVPLVTDDGIDTEVLEEPEVTDHREAEAEQ